MQLSECGQLFRGARCCAELAAAPILVTLLPSALRTDSVAWAEVRRCSLSLAVNESALVGEAQGKALSKASREHEAGRLAAPLPAGVHRRCVGDRESVTRPSKEARRMDEDARL